MVAARFWRRQKMASPVLAAGAAALMVMAIVGLATNDPRYGQGAVEDNQREYHFVLACQLPVLLLALISWKRFAWAFWVGWTVNLAFTAFVAAIVIWLEFFWHW